MVAFVHFADTGYHYELMNTTVLSLSLCLVAAASTAAALDAPAPQQPVGADAQAQAAVALGTLPDFHLLDHMGRSHTAHRYIDAAALVFMAVSPKGEEARASLAEFARLSEQYSPHKIYFFAITPSAAPGQLPAASGNVPVLLDDAQIALPAIGLDHANECLIAETAHWNVLFRGDLRGQPGASRGLADALASFKEGGLVPFASAALGPALALEPMPEQVSYARDIAPLLERRCVSCHSDGQIGPFAMSSHRKVAGWAPMMAETVRAGRMPPWQADPGFGEFSNAMELSNQEKRKLLAWLEAGAPNDSPGADPLAAIAPAASRDWKLGQPDKVVPVPQAQRIPAEGQMEYIYYDVPLHLPPGTWLRGTEMRTQQPQVNHHMLVYLHDPGEPIDFTQEYIASYVPGHDPGFFPEGTGKPVPPDASLLFQLHYTPNGKPVEDAPELALYFCKTSPTREIFLGSAVDRSFQVPPFATEAEASASFIAPADITIYSLSPHMHYRGRRMFFEAFYPDGQREVLLSVPDYDFMWQHSYHLAQPKRIPKGTEIKVAGAFDNSVRNPLNPDPSQRLSWGDQSTDEMFIGSVLYAAAE